jgi:hypothetical protein
MLNVDCLPDVIATMEPALFPWERKILEDSSVLLLPDLP